MLAAGLRCGSPAAHEATQLTAARFVSVRRGHALSEAPAEAVNITDACAKVRPLSLLAGGKHTQQWRTVGANQQTPHQTHA